MKGSKNLRKGYYPELPLIVYRKSALFLPAVSYHPYYNFYPILFIERIKL